MSGFLRVILLYKTAKVCPGADLRTTLNSYAENLDESDVRGFQDIIDFDIKHPEEELPAGKNRIELHALEQPFILITGHANQDFLIASQEQRLGPNKYQDHFNSMLIL